MSRAHVSVRSARTRPAPRAATPSTGSPGCRRWLIECGSPHMHGLSKRPGYRLCSPDSPEAGGLLAEQGLGPADPKQALAQLERAEGTKNCTIAGINGDGVFGTSRAGWRLDLPQSCEEPFIPLLWIKVYELLDTRAQ